MLELVHWLEWDCSLVLMLDTLKDLQLDYLLVLQMDNWLVMEWVDQLVSQMDDLWQM